jgi:uncharacterized protein (DUF302 family)
MRNRAMKIIRNLLALVGLAAIAIAIAVYVRFGAQIAQLDPGVLPTYSAFVEKVLDTGDSAVAMMWAVPVADGVAPEDVVNSLKSIAASHSFLFVGESPLYKQIEAVTGEPYRYVNFLSFCDARVGAQMLDYRNEYSGFMPCRIAIVQDKNGKLWLYSMNLDLMIHGGRTLPPELMASAVKVRDTIKAIMDGAAKGEF